MFNRSHVSWIIANLDYYDALCMELHLKSIQKLELVLPLLLFLCLLFSVDISKCLFLHTFVSKIKVLAQLNFSPKPHHSIGGGG